jgi:hypothetical protein
MRYQPLTVTVKGVWLYLCSHKWLMETRLISRCKKVVIVVMVVSTFIVVASATRAITARCFWGNKEVKARGCGTRWFLYVRSFILITSGHFVDQPSLSLSLSTSHLLLFSFSPIKRCSPSVFSPVSSPIFLSDTHYLSSSHTSFAPPVAVLSAFPYTAHIHRIHCSGVERRREFGLLTRWNDGSQKTGGRQNGWSHIVPPVPNNSHIETYLRVP